MLDQNRAWIKKRNYDETCGLVETRGSVLYVNPGSAGPRRFRLPISLGFLDVRSDRVQARLQELHPS